MHKNVFVALLPLLGGCYLHHTLGSTDGDGGALDSSLPPTIADAAGPVPTCPLTERCTVADGSDIRAIAVDDERVYWVEHGTFDALGNHRGDGRLRVAPVEGGPATTILEGLAGPVDVRLTSTHVFIGLASATREDGTRGAVTARVAREGGSLEHLTNEPLRRCGTCFASDGDLAVWVDDVAIRVQGAADATPRSIREGARRAVTALALDGDDALVLTAVRGGEERSVLRIALDDGETMPIATLPLTGGEDTLALVDDELWIEEGAGRTETFLSRKPIDGGAWARAVALPNGERIARIVTADRRIAISLRRPGRGLPIAVHAATPGDATLRTIVDGLSPEFAGAGTWNVPFDANAELVLWVVDDGSAIVRAPW
ncbi:hypothetical protein [Sandaracinus amylolyticus]|uniref:hypothetical protein n=1 Tax=Sandaracinus amylolyticus TaxID=927083 RepID=UPI001F2BD965|nr:hypothetical protein [Sandaracinus amylolyticus]UJR84355.1 Hypothetical protein I5071_64340 [Sandaracinus amylolyticus]